MDQAYSAECVSLACTVKKMREDEPLPGSFLTVTHTAWG